MRKSNIFLVERNALWIIAAGTASRLCARRKKILAYDLSSGLKRISTKTHCFFFIYRYILSFYTFCDHVVVFLVYCCFTSHCSCLLLFNSY